MDARDRLPTPPGATRRALLRAPAVALRRARRSSLDPAARGRGLLRSPDRFARATAAEDPGPRLATAAAIVPPPAAVVVLTRCGFGPAAGDVAAFQALGATDGDRVSAWLDAQLAPSTIDDSACDARLAASGFTTLGKSLGQLWADHVLPDDLPWEERVRPLDETRLATWIRAVHSRRQLLEVLVDFWHNHFNVYADDWPHAAVWPHTDRDAIRANALGNFRTMIEAVAKTPAMLYFLDNFDNSADFPIENYARELLELHGLGAENYYGNTPAALVPKDGQGKPLGYCDEDVTQAARCLTGWTVSDRPWIPGFGDTGLFLYWNAWHDQGAKTPLGATLPANQAAMKDGRDLFDLIASHPGTARFIARKLCRRLLADTPPQAVVDAAAATFAANVAASDQIARVVRTIVTHPTFLSTWGEKVKRPFEFAVSAIRGAGGDLPFTLGDDPTGWFLWMYEMAGQPLFAWHAPNGFPDFRSSWKSTSPRVMCWRLANMLVQVDDGVGHYYLDVLGQTPAEVRSSDEIVDFWTARILGFVPADPERAELVEFMAQGHNPSFDLPLAADEETQDRLRALVALIFMSPSFQLR